MQQVDTSLITSYAPKIYHDQKSSAMKVKSQVLDNLIPAPRVMLHFVLKTTTRLSLRTCNKKYGLQTRIA